jgi:hypothetical protein
MLICPTPKPLPTAHLGLEDKFFRYLVWFVLVLIFFVLLFLFLLLLLILILLLHVVLQQITQKE